MNNYSTLLFRRQYLLTNQKIDILKDWNHLPLKKANFSAYIHPELSFTYCQNPQIEVLLLGYILSYQSPEKTDKEIVSDLTKYTNFHDFVRATYSLGGRFLLLFSDGKQTYLLPDTFRMRMAYYYFVKDSDAFYIAPQGKLISHCIDLEKEDNPQLLKLLSSELFVSNDKSLPGKGSFYKGLYNLNANHYLDFQQKTQVRFFPSIKDEKPIMTDIDQGIKQCNQILEGILKALYLRHSNSIVMPFTAGWDSRLLVSMSKDIKDDIQYFINKFPHMTEEYPDISIPKKLSNKLGLNFMINSLNSGVQVSQDFKNIYQDSYDIIVERYLEGHYTQSLLFKDKMMMHTVGNEIAKCTSMYGIDSLPITMELLNYILWFGNKYEYINLRTTNWIEEMQAIPKMKNIQLPELYSWENIESNKTSHLISIADMYCETCSIFNCRDYITTMWTIPIPQRTAKQKFALRMIEQMWKELLSEPLNPPTNLRGRFKLILKELGIFDTLRRYRVINISRGS